MNNIIVSPSILSCDFANLKSEVERTKEFGAKWVHIDVMDGHFVPNITIGAPVVKSLRNAVDMFLDVHLMIDDPIKYSTDFIEAGADLITFHYEATGDRTLELINKISSSGKKVGLSIKPNTPVYEIKKYIPYLDLVLIMTVEPGFGGQKFIDECAAKIGVVKQYANDVGNFSMYIQVDGGINGFTGKKCKSMGANCLVAGNYIFKSENMKSAIENLLYV